MKTEKISKEKFNQMPKGIGENKLLDFFVENEKTAFTVTALLKEIKDLKSSRLYVLLKNLIAMGRIERRGYYYSLKEQEK